MNIKVKVANLVAVVVFGFITYLMANASATSTSLQTFELLFVPMFFTFLAFVGFVVGFFAYGNKVSK